MRKSVVCGLSGMLFLVGCEKSPDSIQNLNYATPNVTDSPIEQTRSHYHSALAAYDSGEVNEAKEYLSQAYISLESVDYGIERTELVEEMAELQTLIINNGVTELINGSNILDQDIDESIEIIEKLSGS